MLLDYIFNEVEILINEVNPSEGGLQEIVPEDEELPLKAVAVVVLQVDVASFGLAHIELFDASACHPSFPPVVWTFVLATYESL